MIDLFISDSNCYCENTDVECKARHGLNGPYKNRQYFFPNIRTLLLIGTIFPISSSEAEGAASRSRRLKLFL